MPLGIPRFGQGAAYAAEVAELLRDTAEENDAEGSIPWVGCESHTQHAVGGFQCLTRKRGESFGFGRRPPHFRTDTI